MTLNTAAAFGLIVYALSVIGYYAFSLHAMREWHSGYWTQRPVSRLAAWHPVISGEWFGRKAPRRAPCDDDWKSVYVMCAMPVANTVLLAFTLVACALEAVADEVVGSPAPDTSSPIDRRLFG